MFAHFIFSSLSPKYQPIIPAQSIIIDSGISILYQTAAKTQPVINKIKIDLIDPLGKNNGLYVIKF